MTDDYVITTKGIGLSGNTSEAEIIRKISSREELEELIERMPCLQTIQASGIRIRKEFYQEAMEKYDDLEWARIIKSVYLRVQDKHYDEFELAYLEKAKAYLYGEIAVIFQISFEDVDKFLSETIKKQLKEF